MKLFYPAGMCLLLCLCIFQTFAQNLNNAGLPSTAASAAYSTRLVRSAYAGFCMRVRRSSDNAEADVAFHTTLKRITASSTVTITAAGSSGLSVNATMPFSSFYAATSCYVTRWYDQSGNNRTAVQATATAQPRIVNAGVIDQINYKAALTFQNNTQVLTYTATNITVQTVNAVRSVPDVNWQYLVSVPANSDFSVRCAGGLVYTTTPNGNDWWNGTGTPNQFWVNGVQNQTFTATTTHTITAYSASPVTNTMSISSTFLNRGMYGGAALAELLLFPASLSTTDRQALESNQHNLVLPLQLISFSGYRNNTTNQLQWQTADEANTRQFVIERKTANNDFNAIGQLPARGQGNGNYAFSDATASEGTVFYRLKMEDLDGKFTYSNTVSLLVPPSQQPSKAYPNPTSDKVFIQVYDKNLLHTKAKLLDVNGLLLFVFTINDWKQPIAINGQPIGTYLVQLNNGEVLTITKK